MPKIVDLEKTRKNIILNAFKVFIDKGYYSTNIVDIANACDMSRTTLYYYFKSKDEIFENTIYLIIESIEKDVLKISNIENLSIHDKVKSLNEKWDKEFNNTNIILILIEVWLAIRREDNQMFKNIKSRLKKMNNLINNLILEKVKDRILYKKEKIYIYNSYIILSILQQIPTKNSDIRDNLIGVFAEL